MSAIRQPNLRQSIGQQIRELHPVGKALHPRREQFRRGGQKDARMLRAAIRATQARIRILHEVGVRADACQRADRMPRTHRFVFLHGQRHGGRVLQRVLPLERGEQVDDVAVRAASSSGGSGVPLRSAETNAAT